MFKRLKQNTLDAFLAKKKKEIDKEEDSKHETKEDGRENRES